MGYAKIARQTPAVQYIPSSLSALPPPRVNLHVFHKLFGYVLRQSVLIVLPVVQFVSGFWIYSNAKLLRNSAGLEVIEIAFCLFAVMICSLLPLGLIRVILELASRRLERSSHSSLSMQLMCMLLVCLLACVCAEAWLLEEEWRFRTQIKANPSVDAFMPRAWPFEGFGLRYSPGYGVWATD